MFEAGMLWHTQLYVFQPNSIFDQLYIMLQKLLSCPKHTQHSLFQYLPLSTSYHAHLQLTAQQLLTAQQPRTNTHSDHYNTFIPNEHSQNIQNQLVLLKLKGYIDQKDVTGKSTEIKRIPKNVQVGTVIEGDAIYASKIRMKKQVTSYTDYYLKLDQEKSFSRRKFNELQKLNQRKKRLKRKIIKKKTKNNGK